MALEIVFQNNNFVIVDKPAETLSVPSRTGAKDPRPVVGMMMQELLGEKIFPVHRLDEDVSGLLLFGLNAPAHRAANQWFENHEVLKTYEALSVSNALSEWDKWSECQNWECKLLRGKKRAYEADFGKPSSTKAKLVGQDPNGRSVWHLQPLTGRSHQLRYEMARHGFPIDGDILYGSQVESKPGKGIALRAFRLDFTSCQNREKFGLADVIELKSIIKSS